MKNSFIVIGVGRSGTSTVAGILHNIFQVKMADKFVPPNATNIDGHWEDMEFRDLNHIRMSGGIDRKQWLDSIKRLIKKREKQNVPWGFKDPRTSMFLDDYLKLFEEPLIIYCSRNRELTVASLKKCYGFTDEEAIELYNKRINSVKKHLKGKDYLEINFDNRVEEADIIKRINKKFNISVKKIFKKQGVEKSVYIAIINQGWMRPELNNYLMTLYQSGIPFKVTYPNLKPASHNRNIAVQKFLKTDYTHFLSIDHDVVPDKQPLDFMFSDKPIIGFPARVYQKGMFNWVAYDKDPVNPPFYRALDIDAMKKEGAKGLLKCDVVGSGAILIQRKVLEKIKAPFSREWKEDGTQKFGLDFAFCRKAEKEGFEIHCAIDYTCEHYKEIGMNKFLSL